MSVAILGKLVWSRVVTEAIKEKRTHLGAPQNDKNEEMFSKYNLAKKEGRVRQILVSFGNDILVRVSHLKYPLEVLCEWN